MGNNWSGEPSEPDKAENISKVAHGLFTPFERLSLKKHGARIGDNIDALMEELGIQHAAGAGVLMRMATSLTNGSIPHQLGLAVAWFDGRLASAIGLSEYEWRSRMFEAASISELGGEPYMPYQDLVDLVTLLISAFDVDPRDQQMHVIEKEAERPRGIELLDSQIATKLLATAKTPAVRYELFASLLDEVPYLLTPLANIWDCLLYDKESTEQPVSTPQNTTLERQDRALLYAVLGPKFLYAIRLYQGTTKGFAMRAFEVGVTKWPSSTALAITGHQPRNYTKWEAKTKAIDQIIPRFFDTPVRDAKRVVFVLCVDEPWKSSYKHTFGKRPVLLQLEPEFRTWRLPPSTVFMAPSVGLGAGLPRPPTTNEHARGTVLFIDSSMEHGVLRHVPETGVGGERFEHRFYVDEVEVLGFGTKQDLEKQQRAWAWEDEEAHRRRNVNVQDDRALLEMAGLVGQYPT